MTLRRQIGRVRTLRESRRRRSALPRLISLLGTELQRDTESVVVLLVDAGEAILPRGLAGALGGATRVRTLVRVHDTGEIVLGEHCDQWSNADGLLATLSSAARPAAIVDGTSTGNRLALLRKVVGALPQGGVYVAVTPDQSWEPRFRASGLPDPGRSAAANRRRSEIAKSVDLVSIDKRLAVVRKLRSDYFTLRHQAIEQVLGDRLGPQWGEVITRREAYSFDSKARPVMHGGAGRDSCRSRSRSRPWR